jgi:hypothetical protein
VGADNEKICEKYYSDIFIKCIYNCWHPSGITKSNYKGGEKMSKNKNKQFKNNNALPKTDVEFANNGLEKVALKAQESKHK